jgi:hypothetical protein
MPRPKRYAPHNPAKIHDRRSTDLLRNADVAAIEVTDPYAVEPGDKIVVMRSIRNDPLAALHSRRQIDEAQYHGGRAFQFDFEQIERGPQAIDPAKPFVDTSHNPQPLSAGYAASLVRLNRAHQTLGESGSSIAHDVLVGHLSLDQVAGKRSMNTELDKKYIGRRFRECLDDLALIYGFGGDGAQVTDITWKPSIYVPGIGLVYLTQEDVIRMTEEHAKEKLLQKRRVKLTGTANQVHSGLSK